MNRIWLNAHVQAAELIRYPSFTVPSAGLPVISYLIFGLPQVHRDVHAANGILLAFAAFAVLGIAMFQFGVGIAADRASAWERYLRTLHAGPGERFAARTLVALAFSVLCLTPLVLLAWLVSPVNMTIAEQARGLLAILLGSVPLALFGIMLGYLLSERAALPVTNLVFLPLSYAGGLFGVTGSQLPSLARRISPWLPTRQWSDIVTGFGLSGQLPVRQVIALTAYGAGFAAVSIWAYRRDETRQYR
ncbi:ABC transporter permease [Jatrophihabitans telluris]|uniref:ABC transporter permease n=1 Tax=Jatrophihabitans telluris TaxID=2038343 RepID=A0ABY4QWT9_9ACTN|nr:ABC transporter permease [Jatrophihabitans telluris]UQX87985.1 ABC transporter permease [Jatrophihabitans telluris]